MLLALLVLPSCTQEKPAPATHPATRAEVPEPEPLPPACGADGGVWVEQLQILPTVFSQARVEVALSAEADVAVACVQEQATLSGEVDIHLLEGSGADRY